MSFYGADTNAPLVIGADCYDGRTIAVCFSEVVDPVSATNLANYGIASNPYNYYVDDTNYTVVAASLRPDQRSVMLTLSQTFPGGVFRLLVTNVADLAGNSRFAGGFAGVHNRSSIDIGSPGVNPNEPGSFFSCNGSDFEVLAGGSGLEGTNDSFHFVYEPWRQSTAIFRVQVTSLEATSRFSSAGLMMRENLTASSRFFSVLATPPDIPTRDGTGPGANAVQIRYRDVANGPTKIVEINPPIRLSYPNVRLELYGSSTSFRARSSTNGLDWTVMGTVTFPEPLPFQTLIGLATTSNNNAPGFVTRALYSNYFILRGDPALPRLLIEQSGTDAVLSWIEPGDFRFYLVSPQNAGAGVPWRAVTNEALAAPLDPGGNSWHVRVIVPAADALQFFRLGTARQ